MTENPQDHDLGDLQRRARKAHRLAWAGFAMLAVYVGLLLVWLIPVGVRYPAASLPGLAFALTGYIRAKRQGARDIDSSVPDRQLPPLQSSSLVWGLLGGAASYMVLAGLGVGVPNANASLMWRIIGGLALGAAGGVAAGMIVPMTGLLIYGALS